MSAHRTPDKTLAFAASARGEGVEVIIAGAGGAAHLPGVVAAKTTLPVIGVPIDSSALKGLDALLAIAQMPGGIPVATMAIGAAGAKNAALLAASILSLGDVAVADRLEAYREEMRQQVEAAVLPPA
jgi:5-(carboxyamino)imidazole ribonucleotide mutase